MSHPGSGELIPTGADQSGPVSSEVQFALVIARMIEEMKHSPEHMRQAVYDLARYKLQEQFTYADTRDIARAQQALEVAIRGVEDFSRKDVALPAPMAAPQPERLSHDEIEPALLDPGWPPLRGAHVPVIPAAVVATGRPHSIWMPVARVAGIVLVIGIVMLAVQQRERLAALTRYPGSAPKATEPTQQPPPQPPPQVALAPAPAARPNPLRPADYGVYAIGTDALAELKLLPGRPPDIRVAVSAALKEPSRTSLPNGHPKFLVFRRDAATNISERADVRVVAKVAREFSAEAAGKKPDEGDSTWVIRNVAFAYRSSPVPDNPEMYELHSDDPALELTPGRYALILKNQAYDFSIEGPVSDPRQCIERVIATTGTFYTDCKKP